MVLFKEDCGFDSNFKINNIENICDTLKNKVDILNSKKANNNFIDPAYF